MLALSEALHLTSDLHRLVRALKQDTDTQCQVGEGRKHQPSVDTEQEA